MSVAQYGTHTLMVQSLLLKVKAQKVQTVQIFYSYKNGDGTLDAMNYTGKQDSANNLATVGFVEMLRGADFDSYVKNW